VLYERNLKVIVRLSMIWGLGSGRDRTDSDRHYAINRGSRFNHPNGMMKFWLTTIGMVSCARGTLGNKRCAAGFDPSVWRRVYCLSCSQGTDSFVIADATHLFQKQFKTSAVFMYSIQNGCLDEATGERLGWKFLVGSSASWYWLINHQDKKGQWTKNPDRSRQDAVLFSAYSQSGWNLYQIHTEFVLGKWESSIAKV
jgi:hypothetical protein